MSALRFLLQAETSGQIYSYTYQVRTEAIDRV